jgi:hypothetical protein
MGPHASRIDAREGAMDVLTDEELAQAQRLIDAADPGVHELRQLYGTAWDLSAFRHCSVAGSRDPSKKAC